MMMAGHPDMMTYDGFDPMKGKGKGMMPMMMPEMMMPNGPQPPGSWQPWGKRHQPPPMILPLKYPEKVEEPAGGGAQAEKGGDKGKSEGGKGKDGGGDKWGNQSWGSQKWGNNSWGNNDKWGQQNQSKGKGGGGSAWGKGGYSKGT